MKKHKSWADNYIDEKVKSAENYFEISNSIYGAIGFSLAIASVSTNDPSIFALMSLFFVGALWGGSIKKIKSALDELRYVEHKIMSVSYVLRRTYPAVIGILMLVFVACKILTADGFSKTLPF